MRRLILTILAMVACNPAFARELVVYTDRQENLLMFIAAAFQAHTGVETTVVYGDIGDLEAMASEGRALPYDVILTKDVGALAPLSARGRISPIRTEQILARVAPAFRDPAGDWIGTSRRTRALHVAEGRVPEGVIGTYEELAGEAWRGRICTRAFDHSYMVQLLAAMIAERGEAYARDWATALRANLAGAPEGSDRTQIRRVAAGECDIALANDYYRGAISLAPDGEEVLARTRIVTPTFETGGGMVMLTAAARVADAENPEEAEDFIAFLLSERGQRITMLVAFEHPVVADIALEGQVAAWGDIAPPTHPVFEVARHRPLALSILREAAVAPRSPAEEGL